LAPTITTKPDKKRDIPAIMSLRTFTANPHCKPNSSLPFKEWAKFASSQAWESDDVKRKAMVDAIREEIIFHYLPDGLNPHQLAREISLTEAHKIKIYQKICLVSGKTAHDEIYKCTAELKRAPYVNIFDFIDAFSISRTLRIFQDWQWNEFKAYTEDKCMIDLKYAKQSEFPVPLLQDMSREVDVPPPPRFTTSRPYTQLPQLSPVSVSSSSPPVSRPSSPVSPPHTPSTSPAASPSQPHVKLSPMTPSPNVDIKLSPTLPSPDTVSPGYLAWSRGLSAGQSAHYFMYISLDHGHLSTHRHNILHLLLHTAYRY
jgi:hypothetical protein